MAIELFNELDEAVAEAVEVGGVDHNEEKEGGGGFDRVVLETGVYPMYLCQYVEMGTQKFNGYQGGKDTFNKAFRWGFAVFNFDVEDDEGNPQVVILTSGVFNRKIMQTPKSEFFKLFKALNYSGDTNIKHIAKFLGSKHTYQGKIIKKKSKKGVDFNELDVSSLTPLFDGLGAKKKRVELPEIDAKDYSLLLWDAPSLVQWDSLQRGKEDVSAGDPKNYIKYEILQATDFEGSALDLLLREQGVDTKVQPKKSKDEVKAENEAEFDNSEEEEFDEEVEEEAPKPKKRPQPKKMPAMPEEE